MMYIRLKSWLCQDVAVTQLDVKLSRLCPTLQAWYLKDGVNFATNCYDHVLQDPYKIKKNAGYICFGWIAPSFTEI